MKAAVTAVAAAAAALIASTALAETIEAPHFRYEVSCVAPDGTERWREDFTNLVTTAGKNALLDIMFRGSVQVTTWYVLLIDATGYTAVAAGDTAASHTGWTEGVPYSNATRPTITWNAAASGQITTSAAASFTVNATATLKGCGAISNNTKSGTTGTLYSAGTFAADRSVQSGDTLNVSITLSV